MLFSCSLVQKELKVEIPDATWPPVVFKPIDTVTEFASLKRLRETHLAEDDLEIRIWRGFSLAPLEGVVLTRISGKWSALYLISDVYVDIKGAYVKQLKAPKSGWDTLWNNLDAEGVSTLPDSSQVDCGPQAQMAWFTSSS